MPKFRSVPQGHHHGTSPEAPFHAGVSPHFPCFSIFHTIKDRISPRGHTRQKAELHCAALPRLVPGCRFVPFKIAASLSLLAMTNLVGFAEKRNNFWNEKVSITAELHCAASASAVPAGASTSGLSSAVSSVASFTAAEVSASGGASRRRGRPSASKNSS